MRGSLFSQIATHEAGHAVMAYLEGQWSDRPVVIRSVRMDHDVQQWRTTGQVNHSGGSFASVAVSVAGAIAQHLHHGGPLPRLCYVVEGGQRMPCVDAFKRGDLARTLRRYGCSPGDTANILERLNLLMDLLPRAKGASKPGRYAVGGMRRGNLRYTWAQVQHLMGQPKVRQAVEAVAHDLLDHPNHNRAKQACRQSDAGGRDFLGIKMWEDSRKE